MDKKLEDYENDLFKGEEEKENLQKELDYLKEEIGKILVNLSDRPNPELVKDLEDKSTKEKDIQENYLKLLEKQRATLRKWRLHISTLCENGKLIEHSKLLPIPGTHSAPVITQPEVPGFIPYCDITIYNNELLGKGTFGTVFRGIVHGNSVAIKVMNDPVAQDGVNIGSSRSAAQNSFRNECAILCRLKNPNILKFMGVSVNEAQEGISNYCLLTELTENGSLYDVLHHKPNRGLRVRLGFNRKMIVIEEIVKGMQYLHSEKVLHLDLKPGNILLDSDYHVRIADFGMSKVATHFLPGVLGTFAGGTPFYMAPEILESERIDLHSETIFKCDVYSFGILLNELLDEKTPYDGMLQTYERTLNNLRKLIASPHNNRPRIFPTPRCALQDLVKSCWHKDPNSRPSFDDILTHRAWNQAMESLLTESKKIAKRVMDAARNVNPNHSEISLAEFMKIIKEQFELTEENLSPVKRAIYIFLDVGNEGAQKNIPLTSVSRFLSWIEGCDHKNLVETIQQVISTPWFFGVMNRSTAEITLQKYKHEGAFLVRWDNEEDSFVLSHVFVQRSDDKTIIEKIKALPKEKVYKVDHSTLNKTLRQLFENFQEMVDRYQLKEKIPPRPVDYQMLTDDYKDKFLTSGTSYVINSVDDTSLSREELHLQSKGIPVYRIIL